MYAIIRTGGKQEKVQVGDIVDVERLRGEGEITFTPLLVVDDADKVFSRREELADAKVVVKIVGEGSGQKVDIFKYKAKTGYRRRQGHRQRFTTIEIISITPPKGAKQTAAKEPAAKPEAAEKAEVVEKPAATAKTATTAKKTATTKKTTPAKSAPAKKTTAATKKATSSAAKSTAARKTAAAKKPAAKSSTLKPAKKKES